MANYNTILIKRRTSGAAGAPSSLSGGELAFNEVDSTLYYGSSTGVISIAGDGAFVNRTTAQSISGVKTFEDGITLPLAPSADSDATNKGYVDTEISSLSGVLQTAINNLDSGTSTAVDNLSSEVYNTFVKLVDDRAVELNGGLDVAGGINADSIVTSSNVEVGGNLTVTGDLQVLGAVTSLETTTTVTSAFNITNTGSQTAFTVEQTGSQDIAEFIDDGATALIVKDGGNVGIGTDAPNEKLTVTGNISATGVLYAAGGVEISAGGGSTSLYVENGKVGVNTEAPNEELTVVGTISATEDIFARNADFTGTLDVDGAATLGSTLVVTGASTLNSTLDVIGASTFASTVSAQGAVEFDSTLNVDGEVTLSNNLSVAGTSTLTGNVSAGANVYGVAGSSLLVDFIIDGGTF